ncbi:glycyl-tRNA synthetase [Halarchaeum rubridurum]|uniref:glycine--tRNA ligase n=1 Tax=Halarchaeum rubridurum TaxID=489911 RepID=A0A830G475_9EURY|nr:glycine--tRNA ligase [Halarchaeum rubridurum]MBP1955790.1 glycyl-tRNA synthetase [Halarchaeum rubridurum]GGM74509.1 glycine--tRNA ligase [Halarchaeum rubridurum]
MTDLVELAKRRGFFFQSSEAYGGVSGFYTYGPQGASLKERVEETWRERFALAEGHMQIDAPTVMPEPVFEASGHLDGFDDMLVECAECGESHRADHLIEGATDIEEAESLPTDEVASLLDAHDIDCPSCGAPLAGQPVDEFNLMFETNIGPGTSQTGYLRPETAQGIFVEFPRLKEYARGQLPFGVTQVGKSYRNEISPRNALVRTREFTQAELELFVDPDGDEPDVSSVADVEVTLYPAENQPEGDYVETTVGEAVAEGVVDPWVAYYLGVATEWYETIGVDFERFRYRQHQPGERAHYATDCWDAEADVSAPDEAPEWIEIAGYAYRGDYDLSKHGEHGTENFTVFTQYDEPKTVERASVDPDMSYLGPEFGGAAAEIADALAALAERDRAAFEGDEVTVDVDGESYTVPTEKTGFEFAEETEAGRHVTPHVVEPSIGIDRTVYTVLAHAHEEDEVDEGERTVLRLDPSVAPTDVAVFPLMDKDGMGERAHEIATTLRGEGLDVTYDDSGNIGRRYRRQDEVGTPFCVTVDYESVDEEPETVTLRERDSTDQVRVPSADLASVLADLRAGETTFDDL